MKILIVEDEVNLCNTIAEGFRLDGYEVDTCYNGKDAWEIISCETYDLVILDLNLPGMDGMEVLRNIRMEDNQTNIIILSARGQIQDRVDGLDAGANDYICKPFHFEELEARVRSLTRRKFVQYDIIVECGEIKLDTKSRKVYIAGNELNLTRKELGVLEYLILHQGQIVSQEELIEHVWDASVDALSNSIRVHISALRRKLRNALGYDPIINRVGQGYILESNAHENY